MIPSQRRDANACTNSHGYAAVLSFSRQSSCEKLLARSNASRASASSSSDELKSNVMTVSSQAAASRRAAPIRRSIGGRYHSSSFPRG